MKSFKTAAQRNKPYGKATVKKLARNQPKLIRGHRADLAGRYRA